MMNESNVQVAVRCRPLNEREKAAGRPSVVQCRPNTNELSIVKRKTYAFDRVYGQYSTQKDVFKHTVKPVVDEALAGYNCTVFAYGQTGTGKTHTMQGALSPDDDMAGIIPRAVRHIFDVLQANYQEYSVKVSFLQLYNEELKDLLVPDASKKLRLMEDVKRGGIYCQNLLEVTTTTASHVFELLETGVKNRITSETLMNENSSRSHSIFTIRIHCKENNPVGGEDLLKIGQLNLVDLAGSECVGRSGARNARAREAGNINQSLLTLGRVITALVDNHPHIPYRDSKLTRLLQESLGGRAKTTIIATLAPCADSIDETISTLEYAFRAKNIKNKPEVNQKMTKTGLLKEYGNEIESLRSALQAARAKDGIYLPPAQFTEMQERLAGQTAQIAELEDELEARSKACKELEAQLGRGCEDLKTDLETHVTGVKRKMEGISRSAIDIMEVSRFSSKQQRSEVEDFIKKRRTDEVTGSTPVKDSSAFPAFERTSIPISEKVAALTQAATPHTSTVEAQESLNMLAEDKQAEDVAVLEEHISETSSLDLSESKEVENEPAAEEGASAEKAATRPPTSTKLQVAPGARKRTLSGGSTGSNGSSSSERRGPPPSDRLSSLAAPKRYRSKKTTLHESTNKL
ncbi:hypothetical protein ATCC90586_003622 [Pythium insidiosum]|nr:hypothetical protein ATCC90586_003622 [Pythium insidiosum]